MANTHRTSILVIDDEEAVRQSFVDYLEDLDYRILTAENGRIGLEIFEQEGADLVLVDLRMPELDGLEVLAHITRTNPDTPLIVVSGTGVIADAVEALHQGAWDYLLKPIEDFSMLAHAVENALEKARLKRENRQYQRHLEQMVDERTRELKLANDHLTQINKRLERIVETTRRISFCDEVGTFGSMLLDEFCQHMLATGGSLYYKQADGLRLIHALDSSQAPDFIPFPIPENSVFQQVMTENRPALIRDIGSVADLASGSWEHYEDGSALVFPLPDESGEVTAVLALHNKKPPPFVEQDREIGSILASYSCEALRAVRATENLRENEQQFRAILDNIQSGIIIAEVNTRQVVYVNPAAAKMAGATTEDIMGRRCNDVLCSAKAGECQVLDLGQEVSSSERMMKTSDGRQIPILKSISRMVYRGQDCLLESFFDLSAQKRAEAEKAALETQLMQAQKMEAIGTLAGGIAHDFNNILSAVIGYTELLINETQKETMHRRNLEQIKIAGMRASDLVSQILTFSRQHERELKPLQMGPLIKEALKLLRSSLPSTIEISQQIDADLDNIMADPIQIHQIVMNLCTNAAQAMDESGGQLIVRLTEVSLDWKDKHLHPGLDPGIYIKLSVKDTGKGVPEEIIDKIFHPYFTTKEKGEGTGLGLSVVHGIVESYGGAIQAHSKHGQGTTFHVYIPAIKRAALLEKRDDDALPTGTEHILFVDDEPALVALGRQILELLGYRVTPCNGSLEALEIFEKSPDDIDLVFSDVTMPKMTGDKLAQKLLKIRPDLPIILCSGFNKKISKQKAAEVGVKKIVSKPLVANQLAKIIRTVLDDSSTGSARA